MVYTSSRLSRAGKIVVLTAVLAVAVLAFIIARLQSPVGGELPITPSTRLAPAIKPSIPRDYAPIAGVGEQSVEVSEPGRTMCVPSTGACSERQYLLHVYYPIAEQTGIEPVIGAKPDRIAAPYPVVVFAAGFDEDPSAYQVLIDSWVKAGYVVAAPVFPLSSRWALTYYGVNLSDVELSDAFESDMLNQPYDMAAALSKLTALNQSDGSIYQGLFDTSEAAAAGQSDGGDTTLALTDNTCCKDSNFKAAMIFSGAQFSPYGGSFYAYDIPMLIVQGTADTINPEYLSEQIFNQAEPPKYLVMLEGADHLEAYTQQNSYESVVSNVSLAFLATYLRGQPDSVTHITSVGNQAGVSLERYQAN